MRLEAAGGSDVGLKRAHNEDAILLAPERALFCVADGMGGHLAGEIASGLAVSEISAHFEESNLEPAGEPENVPKGTTEAAPAAEPEAASDEIIRRDLSEERLVAAICRANAAIHRESRGRIATRGMGTTIVALHIAHDRAFIAHVGDSRAYHLESGTRQLTQLTEDHSLLNDYLKAHPLDEEEIARFPHKNVIVRALGMHEEVAIDVTRREPREGDLFLLCSDGLSGLLSRDELLGILCSEASLERARDRLIEAAKAAGGNDNISVVLVRCLKLIEDPPCPAASTM